MNETISISPRARGRRPAVDDVDRRERLLDCATLLFSQRGIAATTMAQIAAKGGVTSAMVHYYFANRERLLDIVVQERILPAVQFVWQIAREPCDGDPAMLAHGLVERLFDVTERLPWLPPLWLREVGNEGGLLRERLLARIPIENIMRFAKRVAAGQKSKAINPDIEPSLLFISILGLVMLPLATAKVWQGLRGMRPISRDALRRHVAALLTSGLVPPRSLHAPLASGARRSRT